MVKNNTGGVHRTKLMTGYREETLLVLNALMEAGGTATTKQIKELSGVEKTTSILYQNYYGWFIHVQKGLYGVSQEGLNALEEYEKILALLLEEKMKRKQED